MKGSAPEWYALSGNQAVKLGGEPHRLRVGDYSRETPSTETNRACSPRFVDLLQSGRHARSGDRFQAHPTDHYQNAQRRPGGSFLPDDQGRRVRTRVGVEANWTRAEQIRELS